MKIQNQLLSCTKQLADNLLINSSSIQEPGLFNGKIGAAIYLFHCFIICGNEEYEKCARELMNQLFELIPNRLPLSFEKGITGIAWGIEYLAQNGFIDKEKDIILNEIDKMLFVAVLKSRTLINNNGIYGMGVYFTQRLKSLPSSTNNLFENNKIQLATYLRDDVERLLCWNTKFAFSIPNLGLEQINSIVYFYSEMFKYQFITVSIERLLDYLFWFTKNLPAKQLGITDIHILVTLLNRVSLYISDASELDRIGLIQNKLRDIILENKLNSDLQINEFIKLDWKSIIYSIDCNELK